MSIFKRDFDKTKRMYFLIQNQKIFDKCNEIWEKASNNIKKFLMKKFPTKKIKMKTIKCINLFLEKTSALINIHPEMPKMWGEIFYKKIRNVCFSGFESFLLKIQQVFF